MRRLKEVAIGMFRPEQWDYLLTLLENKTELGQTYEDWEVRTNNFIEGLKLVCITPIKFDIDVNELENWCCSKGISVNGKAIAQFAAGKLTLEKGRVIRFFHISNRIIKHPIILVIIAALLSTWLIPTINLRSERKKILYQKRQNIALEILSHNKKVNSKLNALQTALEMFHKDNRILINKRINYKQEQKVLRQKMHDIYLEFDNDAWFWYWKVYQEVLILNIFSKKEMKDYKSNFLEYENNLIKTLNIIKEFWEICLSDAYSPEDKEVTRIMNKSRESFSKMMLQQNNLIDKIIQLFVSVKI